MPLTEDLVRRLAAELQGVELIPDQLAAIAAELEQINRATLDATAPLGADDEAAAYGRLLLALRG